MTAETSIDWLVLDQMSLRDAIDRVPGLGWKILHSVAACLSVAARLSDANTELT